MITNFSQLSLIKFFKIIEICIFAYLVKTHLTKKTYPQFIFVLSLSLLFQSGLAIAQFFNHGSLNGIFYWFGERNFSSTTLGIANASINGALVLRSYGTFPHPNVLAGFLLMGIILLIQRTVKQYDGKTVASKTVERFFNNITIKQYNNFLMFVIAISSLALFLTLSRVVIGLWIVFVAFYVFRRGGFFNPPDPAEGWEPRAGYKPAPTKIILIALTVALVLYILSPRYLSIFGEDKQSYENRVAQSQIALAMFRDHPLTGVGLNQYLVELPKYMKITSFKDYQPVHNVFLLVLAETGLIGFLLIVWLAYKLLHCFIASLLKKKNSNGTMEQWNNRYLLIFVFLIFSLFDHYFYTLQQGNLMIGLIAGIIILKQEKLS